MKKYLAVVIFVVCIVIGVFYFKISNEKDYSFIASVPISDVADKFTDGELYLTVVFEDDVVKEYHLSNNKFTIPVNKDVYDQIVVNDGFIGVTLQVTIPEGQTHADIGTILKEGLVEYCKIIAVTKTDNIVIS